MPNIKTVQDADFAIGKIQRQLDLLFKRDVDMKRYRISNMGASVDPNDAVIRKELTNEILKKDTQLLTLQNKVVELEKRIEVLENP